MGFLRRLFGGGAPRPDTGADEVDIDALDDLDADERQREIEVLRDDRERMDDLAQRQLRYAEYGWTPPAEGGTQRADDADASREDR